MLNAARTLLTLVALWASVAAAQFELDLTGSDTKKAPTPEKKKGEKPGPADEGGLDLSSTADVKLVLLLPPVVKVTTSQGGFSGFDTRKTFEKFDFAAHKRFVMALAKALEGKVVAAEAAQAAITSEGITLALARTSAGRAKLARAVGAAQVVTLEFNKAGGLVATVHGDDGEPQGEPFTVANAAGLTQKHADEMGGLLGQGLIALAKAKAPESTPVVQAPPPPVQEDVVDAPPLEVVSPGATRKGWSPDPDRTRVAVAVGGGGVLRGLSVDGESAGQLAELRNNGVAGVGVYAQVSPLQFVPSLAASRWADLELEVHFRRAFVRATGVGGSVEGTRCSVTDDDLQLRGTYRVKVATGTYAPLVGLGAGWSQERTVFEACSLPLVSATYRGLDAQLRVDR
ncbi:MAG: hypothetical protein INH37_25455, partial [Myxococcaceae bacterium]|nr:hypothetical protein [Myxococcaceae bacterium]